ncbi:MAG: alkaline phosphatase D family protein [Rhodocyclaceae bacterium]|nr:alkaline phosphatase D family protein [Rhodocyclaceae bacterium]
MNIDLLARRVFLRKLLALAGGAFAARAWAADAPKWQHDPFALGVASGSPRADGVVLWTRLVAPGAELGQLLPHGPLAVGWEVAADKSFDRIIASGNAVAVPELAHSVHVELRGLAPDRWYWYRFRCGSAQSSSGRTRTLPAADSRPERLRFAFASCQNYERGHYGAYRHMARENLDLVVFLGDYIYEYGIHAGEARAHTRGECFSLDDYRARYALYRSDPALAAMHAEVPWLFTWDDHEVANDYANDRAKDLTQDFIARRAAAYQAYYEHQPLAATALIDGAGSGRLRIYDRYDWGRLARISMLDCRQYRNHQACQSPERGGSGVVDEAACPERLDAARSMLGAEQEAWLEAQLKASPAGWNFIAQSTLMAQSENGKGTERRYWTDAWDGYPAARHRLLGALVEHKVRNPVVLGGDIHATWVTDLKLDFDDPKAAVVATEFCGTSITSTGWSQSKTDAVASRNPHVKWARSDRRGYTLVDLDAERARVYCRAVDSTATPNPAIETLAAFEVVSGTPGARRIA